MPSMIWCPDCKRSYVDGTQRGDAPVRLCAYFDCFSLADLAHIRWDDLRQVRPELPERAVCNQRYEIEPRECELAWRL
jgi:hypothetical protein